MADFSISLAKTLLLEGGFLDRSKTTGEVANRGITLNTLWRLNRMPEGMKRSIPPTPPSAAEIKFVKNLSMETTADIYRTEYWAHLAGDDILYQPLADKLFDVHVNTGQGMRLIQRAVNRVHWPGVPTLVEDGILGRVSVGAINATDGRLLLGHCGANGEMGVGLRGEAEHYYRNIPDPGGDLEAWLARLRKD